MTSTDPAGGAAAWNVEHVEVAHPKSSEECGANGCSLEEISCPSTSFCAATDFAGYVFTTSDPAAGAGSWSISRLNPVFRPSALSCASALLCVAVNYTGSGVYSTSPASGASSWHAENIGSGPCPGGVCRRSLDAISCPSVSLCVAGDWGGSLIALTNPTAGDTAWNEAFFGNEATAASDSNLARIATGFTWPAVGPISCASASMCVAGDKSGLLTSTDPAGGAPAWKLSPANLAKGLLRVDCPSASFCIGLQPSEVALTNAPLTATEWESEGEIDPGAHLTDISCSSAHLCVAVDDAGNVIVGRAKPPSRAQIQSLLRAEMTPHGSAAQITALLRQKTFSLSFNPPMPGRIRIRWLFTPPSSRSSSHRAKPVVIARGRGDLPESQSATIPLRLTRNGLALLSHRNRVRLIAEASFSQTNGPPIRATSSFTLQR